MYTTQLLSSQPKLNSLGNPSHIEAKHWQEWLNSGVDPAIIAANVKSLADQRPYDYLLTSPHLERTNTGRVASWVLQRYAHVEKGGWWVEGEDLGEWQKRLEQKISSILERNGTGERMLWGAFKPDDPYIDEEGKTVRYEPPPRTPTRVFCLSIPSSPHFWLEVLANAQMPIIIVEGAKKAGCLLTLGYAAIAIPGIFNGYRKSTQKLIEDLAMFAVPERPVYICFDHDTKPQTIQNVNLAIARLGQLFQQQGCEVHVISLPGPEKGVDDFVVAQGAAAFHQLFEEAPTLRQWHIKRFIHNQYRLTFAPDWLINTRYLENVPIPAGAKLVGIRAPKGSGKTERIAAVVAEAIANGQPVLILTHRIQLGGQLSQRFGIPYVTEVKSAAEGRLLGFALCVDSLHGQSEARFSAEGWQNALVIIDECESVIWHTLDSETCIKNRISILQTMRDLFEGVLSPTSHGQVVCADADLSNLSINFIRRLGGYPDLKPYIIRSDWRPKKGWSIYDYQKPADWLIGLETAITTGGNHLVFTTGQRIKSTWGTQTLYEKLRQKFPDKRIVRIDAETVKNPKHPAFGCISNLNQFLQNWDIVVVSPIIESGVSIELYNHFAGIWGLFMGITPENSVRQTLARLRDIEVPRHICVANRGLNIAFVGNCSTFSQDLLKSEVRKAQVNLQALKDLSILVSEEGTVTIEATALETWGRMGARINMGLHHYHDVVIESLRQEGHTIHQGETCLPKDEAKAVASDMKEIRKVNQAQEAELIAERTEIKTQEEYESLKAQPTKTLAEHHQERNWELRQRYPVTPTPELVLKDDAGWYALLKCHYYLTIGHAFLKIRDAERLQAIAPEGKVLPYDTNRQLISSKVLALKALGIDQVLKTRTEFHLHSPEVQSIFNKALRCAEDVQTFLGVKVTPEVSPIGFVNDLLFKYLGFRLRRDGQRGTGRDRRWIYIYEPPKDGREEILAAWLQQDKPPQAPPGSIGEASPRHSSDELFSHANSDSLRKTL